MNACSCSFLNELVYYFQSIDAEKALECPCIADLRKGPCGSQFSEAFLCFLKSTSEEKVSVGKTVNQILCTDILV